MSQTWEARCATCGELRWPYQKDQPSAGWACMRCRSVPSEKREARVEQGQRARRTRLLREQGTVEGRK